MVSFQEDPDVKTHPHSVIHSMYTVCTRILIVLGDIDGNYSEEVNERSKGIQKSRPRKRLVEAKQEHIEKKDHIDSTGRKLIIFALLYHSSFDTAHPHQSLQLIRP